MILVDFRRISLELSRGILFFESCFLEKLQNQKSRTKKETSPGQFRWYPPKVYQNLRFHLFNSGGIPVGFRWGGGNGIPPKIKKTESKKRLPRTNSGEIRRKYTKMLDFTCFIPVGLRWDSGGVRDPLPPNRNPTGVPLELNGWNRIFW